MMHPMRIQYIRLAQTKNGRDLRFKRTLRLLVAKGYLSISLPIRTSYRGQLSIQDLLWVCENVESKFFQLIPALLLRFPKHFSSNAEWPEDLKEVMISLKENRAEGPPYHGVPYEQLKKWVDYQPRDRRSKKIGGRHLSCRLNSEAGKVLDDYCEAQGISLTDGIHRAVSRLGNPVKNRI